MAVVTNLLLQGMRGKLGNLIFFTRNGKTFVRLAVEGRPKNASNPHQQRITKKFKEAAKYAHDVLQDSALRALYAARDHKKRGVYRLAFRDAFHAPKINHVNTEQYHGLAGNAITISASDNFNVVSVLVTITDSVGNILEQGEAIAGPGIIWLYEAKVDNPAPCGCGVRVTARDLPGNQTTHEFII